jgi:nicotinamidase-related amidase
MSVVNLRDFKEWRGTPTLVLVDLHRSWLDVANDVAGEDISSALANCRVALCHARTYGMPVAFVRLIDEPVRFGDPVRFPVWFDGFEPNRMDMVFDRQKPSCYANADFADMADHIGGHCVLAGLFGETSCLSTVVDAHHRNHRFTYLADASASRAVQGVSPASVHETVAGIVALYAGVESTQAWIRRTCKTTIEAVP